MRYIKGISRFEYNQLSNEAKQRAQNEVIEDFKTSLVDALNKAKTVDLHSKINDKYHMFRLVNRAKLISNITNDKNKLVRVIESNLCHFTSDGAYLTYFK